MMNKSILIVAALACFVAPAFGQTPSIDYVGFGWEDGGFPASNPGDRFYITCVGVSADAIFGIDLGTEELTVYIYDLVSTGEVDLGGGNFSIAYTGGMMEVYNDPAKNADWGTIPPNATAPGTFTDGNLFFKGSFNNFTVFIGPGGAGGFDGTLDGIGGSMIDGGCTGCAFTWGGEWTRGAEAGIPLGYDLQIDGVLEIQAAVATEDATWGSLKALYRN